MEPIDRPIECAASCSICAYRGLVRVVARPGEASYQTAERHARETRSACLLQCAYVARPAE